MHCTDELYSGVLAPFLNLHETYTPHMTIGRVNTATAFAEALEQTQQSLTAYIETDVSEISAYAIAPGGERQVVCTVPPSGTSPV